MDLLAFSFHPVSCPGIETQVQGVSVSDISKDEAIEVK
jgi:hypothetical protein